MHQFSLPQQVICQRISTLGSLLPLSGKVCVIAARWRVGGSVRQFRGV